MNILRDLWDLIFPRECILCDQTLRRGEEQVCLNCLARLPRTGFHLIKDNLVEQQFWGKIPLERATSYFFFASGNDVSELLHSLKYRGNQQLGEVMGRMIATELLPSGFFNGIDFMHPVPLHKRRKRQRGYNQSECLCRGISAITGIPFHTDWIVRSRDNETQTRKNTYERWENVEDLFACARPEMFRDKHVLLVDDVLTTGATITACADSLTDVPGLRISIFTLALAGGRT